MSCCTLSVRREKVLESAMSYLEGFSSIDIQHIGVEFHNEPGIFSIFRLPSEKSL